MERWSLDVAEPTGRMRGYESPRYSEKQHDESVFSAPECARLKEFAADGMWAPVRSQHVVKLYMHPVAAHAR
jgi:hypothetical protein